MSLRAIPGAEAVNQRLSELILERASQEPGVQQTNRGGWQSKNDLLDWPYPEIDQLKHWIVDAVMSMTVHTTGNPEIKVGLQVSAWANVNRFGDFNTPHSHPQSNWSGVYYVRTGAEPADNQYSGMIEFFDPRFAVEMNKVPGDPFYGRYKVRPEDGMVLVFPSWLLHFVYPYLGEDERISISFNAWMRKTHKQSA